MFTRCAALFAFILAVTATPSPAPRQAACSTVTNGTGTLVSFFGSDSTGFDNFPLSLTSGGLLTYVPGGTDSISVEFQSCPSAGTSGYEFTGRIVATAPASISGQCLTVTDPTVQPFFVGTAACSSDSDPEDAQLFGFGDDFGSVILFTGGTSTICPENGAGILVNSTSTSNEPFYGASGAIEFGCPATIGSSFQSVTLA